MKEAGKEQKACCCAPPPEELLWSTRTSKEVSLSVHLSWLKSRLTLTITSWLSLVQLCLLSPPAQQKLLFLHKIQFLQPHPSWREAQLHTSLEGTNLSDTADLPEGRAGSHVLPGGRKLNSDSCALLRFVRVERHARLAGVKFILHRISLKYYTEWRQYVHHFVGTLLYTGNVLNTQRRRGRASAHLHHHGVHHVIKSPREGNEQRILKEAASSAEQTSSKTSSWQWLLLVNKLPLPKLNKWFHSLTGACSVE